MIEPEHCFRCQHIWTPRPAQLVDDKPRRCPHCGSTRWDEPRREVSVGKEKENDDRN